MSHNLRFVLKRNLSQISIFITFLSSIYIGCQTPPRSVELLKKEGTEPHVVSTLPPARLLDPLTERSISRYGRIIHKYSKRYDFDWRLVLAIMKQESRFKHTARSHRGAYGLMQIMPVTQVELVERLGVPDATTPYNNIRAGMYHLKTLYGVFDGAPEHDRLCLTLAAYNAGLSRILDAQEIAHFLGDDPNSWKAVKEALPLLSQRYSTLHKRIWETGTPRGGYFRGWRQTTSYVENILRFYNEYRLVLSDRPSSGL
jgi:membrane-bound lytic murein transglycosylase MltF